MNDRGVLAEAIILLLCGVAIVLGMRCSGDCYPHEAGQQRANRNHGGRIERCDGVKWTPVVSP